MFDKIYIEITNTCNHSCIVCPNSKLNITHNHLPLDVFKKIINICTDCNIFRFGLTPIIGEVLSNPDYKEILMYLEKNSKVLDYHFFTNVLSLNTIDIIFLKTLKKAQITITFDGMNKEDFKFFTGTSEFMECIILLKTLNENFIISFKQGNNTINSLLKNIIKDKKYYIEKLNTNWGGLNTSRTQNFPLLKDYKVHGCKVLYSKNMIRMNGDFCLCGCRDINHETKIGNIFEETLENIIKSKEYNQIPELCKTCTGE